MTQQSQPIPLMTHDPHAAAIANHYFQPNDHDLTGGLPINLDSLRDGPPGTKPFYPYSTLIRYAIKGSPNQKLLLEDIYYAIESRFPYFRTAPNGWKNSVRHNLSLNPCFEKVPRPLTDRGKGSYWTVNDNVDPRTGVHRIRNKKGGKGKAKRSSEDPEGDPLSDDAFHPQSPPEFVGSQPLPTDEDGQLRPPFPLPLPDPHLMMSRFPPLFPGEPQPELDENGQPDWRSLWLKELGHLQQLTSEQEKAGVDQEWYRLMIWRVRTALLPPMNPDGTMLLPPDMVHPDMTQPPQQQQPGDPNAEQALASQ